MWDLIVSVPDHCLSFYFPVFYLCYFFYIPADTKFRACALIIIGSYHFFQRTERQKRFLISHNRFIYITKS